MARLNTRTSATPAGRASTVDSLYRDPTPISRLHRGSTARQSSYSVISPSRSMNSDKENDIPASREETPQPARKGKTLASRRTQRPPTPDSGSLSGQPNKRRRTGDYTLSDIGGHEDENDMPIYEDETDRIEEEEEGDEREEEDQHPLTPIEDDEEEGGSRYYNPQQNPEKRRRVRTSIRNQHRDLEDHRDELIRPDNNYLEEHVRRANNNLGKVRQTAEAVLDSRVMVYVSDLAGKKLNQALHGNTGVGIDVDQFVSRCMFFMKEGRPAGSDEGGSTQSRNRRQTQAHTQYDDDEEDEEDVGEGLDWAFLGREACFPNNKRPPVSSFLLGPLSVQKRVRAVQTRRARLQRQPLGPATRPQEIRQEDMQASENSSLTTLVKGIKERLEKHIDDGSERIEEELTKIEQDEQREPDDEDQFAACSRHRVFLTPTGEGAVSLFDFAVNPHSFGQTVENLFYISFLIREGNAKVLVDHNNLPLLVPEQPHSLTNKRQQNIEKHQAIFSIDWPTWEMLIEAFDIKTPLIPHREPEETNVAPGGWYG